MSAPLRGYTIAVAAIAVCVATWTAVVNADEGMARGVGVYRDVMLRGMVCSQVVYAARVAMLQTGHRSSGFSLDVCGY